MNNQRASQGLSWRRARNIQQGRRGFLTMMGGTGAALLAAACGGNSNSKPSGAATTAATRAATATSLSTTAAATAASSPAAVRTTPTAPVRVTTVSYIDSNNADAEIAWDAKFEADFAAAFPQYHVAGQHFSSTDFFVKMQTALATNSPPDMIFRDGNGLEVFDLWNNGLLAPVNDVMEDIFKMIGGKDKFDAAALDRYTAPTGEVIGVPVMGSPSVWWYRTDLLQEAGLTPPAGHWDWTFLLKAVKAMHKPPKVYGLATPLGRNIASQYLVAAFILGNGGHFVSQDLKDVVFDSPEVRDAVDVVKELAQYAPPGATSWGRPDQVDAIARGGVAMGEYAGRVMGDIITKNPTMMKNYANALMPYQKDPRTYGVSGPHALFKGKNLAGAKELAKFSMRKDNFITLMRTSPGQYAPAIPSYGADPSYTEDPVLKAYDPKILATIVEMGKYPYDPLKEAPGWKVNPKGGALLNSLIIADVVQKVALGKESTQSAVSAGAAQIRELMKG